MVTSADFINKNTSPILKTIHDLFERLGWSNDGILDGKLPKSNPNSIDTQKKTKNDDGEFIYCLPRNPDFISPLYDPYDLIQASANDVLKVEEYYTISATYVCRVRFLYFVAIFII